MTTTVLEFANNVVYLVIVIDSLILIGLGIYIAAVYFQNSDIRKEGEKVKRKTKEQGIRN